MLGIFKIKSFGLVSALGASVLIFLILQSQYKILIAVGVGVLIYLLYERFILANTHIKAIMINEKLRKIYFLLPIFLYVLAVLLLINVDASVFLYSNWYSISFTNWLKAFAGIYITTIFPGYILLRVIDSERHLSKMLAISLIPLLSIFFSGLLSIITLKVGFSFSFVPYSIMLFDGLLISIYIVIQQRKKRILVNTASAPRSSHVLFVDLNALLIIAALVVILSLSIITVFFSSQSFVRGDMWRDVSGASRFVNMTPDIVKSETGRPMFDPYWYELYLGSVFASTAFPLVNVTLILIFLNILSIFIFYGLSTIFFKKTDIALLATVVWSLFSGLGWLFVVSSIGTSTSWYDALSNGVMAVPWSISKPFGFWANDLSGERAIAFLSLLALMSATLNNRMKLKQLCILTSLLVVTSYLLHVFEAGVFVVIFWPIISLFLHRRSDRENTWLSLSISCGLLIVFLIDSLSIYQYYKNTFLIYFFLYSVAIIIFVRFRQIIIFSLKQRFNIPRTTAIFFSKFNHNKSRAKNFLIKKRNNLLVLTFFALYFFTFLLYFIVNFSYSGILLQQRAVPWYLYPLKLGTAGVLIVSGITALIYKGSKIPKQIKIIVFALFVLFLFGNLITYIKTNCYSMGYEEMRVVDEMFPFIALVAGWVLYRAFLPVKRISYASSKKLLYALFIAFLIVTGVLSSLLSAEYWAINTGPYGGGNDLSSDQINALNYLRLHCSANDTVATVPSASDEYFISLTGLQSTGSISPDIAKFFLQSSGPVTFYGIAATWNIRYLYISKTGYDLLESYYNSSFLFQQGLNSLRVCFNSPSVNIYQIVIPLQYASSGFGVTSLNITIHGDLRLIGNFLWGDQYHDNQTSAINSQTKFTAEMLDLRQAKNVMVDGGSNGPLTYSNITISSLSFSDSYLPIVETTMAELRSGQAETYMMADISKPFTLSLVNTSGSSTVSLLIMENNQIHNITVFGDVTIKGISPFSKGLTYKTPVEVQVDGDTSLNNAIAFWSSDLQTTFNVLGPLSYKTAHLNGLHSFKIVGSDNSVFYIDNFDLKNVTSFAT